MSRTGKQKLPLFLNSGDPGPCQKNGLYRDSGQVDKITFVLTFLLEPTKTHRACLNWDHAITRLWPLKGGLPAHEKISFWMKFISSPDGEIW